MAEKATEGSKSTRIPQPGAVGTQGQAIESRQGTSEQQGARASSALQRRLPGTIAGAFGRSPFTLMRRMIEDLDQMFEDFGVARTFGSGRWPGEAARGGGLSLAWSPAIEAFERDGQFVVRADLPGLSPNDVRVEVAGDSLVIEGERRSEIEVKEEEGGLYRSERAYGRFYRSVPLPEGADVEKAQAKFENGVLEVSIPLSEQARRRRIEIQAASGQQQTGSAGAVH